MQRTTSQNKSLHRWFRQIADKGNESGIGLRCLMDNIRVEDWPLTEENVKDTFKVVMGACYPDKSSTTELSTAEMAHLVEIWIKFFGERIGLELPPFPSEDSLS
jgi:hypothetical protein